MVVQRAWVRRPVYLATSLALLAVLPLFAPELWDGFRLGLSDVALGVIAPTEQPLSVRTPSGVWAIGLALTWLGLAYWHRKFAPWEAVLIVVGSLAALVRLGNAWLDALALVAPLARQLSLLTIRPAFVAGLAAICLAVGIAAVVLYRPPDLPMQASRAAQSAVQRGTVLADWRWAAEVQRVLGPSRVVWAAAGLSSESADFWLDYLRVAQGHQRWAVVLQRLDVDLVIFDASGQQRQAAELVRASADWHVTVDSNGVLVAERVSS